MKAILIMLVFVLNVTFYSNEFLYVFMCIFVIKLLSSLNMKMLFRLLLIADSSRK